MAKRQLKPVRLPAPTELREWAEQHGFEIAERGRISLKVELAYLDVRKDYLDRAQKRLRTQGLA